MDNPNFGRTRAWHLALWPHETRTKKPDRGARSANVPSAPTVMKSVVAGARSDLPGDDLPASVEQQLNDSPEKRDREGCWLPRSKQQRAWRNKNSARFSSVLPTASAAWPKARRLKSAHATCCQCRRQRFVTSCGVAWRLSQRSDAKELLRYAARSTRARCTASTRHAGPCRTRRYQVHPRSVTGS